MNKLKSFCEFLWKNFFQEAVNKLLAGILKGWENIVSIIVISLLGWILSDSIIDNVINIKEDYIKAEMEISFDNKLIHLLTGIPFWANILFVDFKMNEENYQTPKSFAKLEKLYKEWNDGHEKHLEFIKENVSSKYVKEQKYLGAIVYMSQSERKFNEIKRNFKEIFKHLKACFENYYKKGNSCYNYILKDFLRKINQTNQDIINFYISFRIEKKII